MSTRREVIQPPRPIGRQVWVAAIVALVLVAAVAIRATRFDTGSIEFVPVQAQPIDATSVPVGGSGGPHGPNQTPKQVPTRDGDIRVHGPNHMPKSQNTSGG
jgi:hypothetical protein